MGLGDPPTSGSFDPRPHIRLASFANNHFPFGSSFLSTSGATGQANPWDPTAGLGDLLTKSSNPLDPRLTRLASLANDQRSLGSSLLPASATDAQAGPAFPVSGLGDSLGLGANGLDPWSPVRLGSFVDNGLPLGASLLPTSGADAQAEPRRPTTGLGDSLGPRSNGSEPWPARLASFANGDVPLGLSFLPARGAPLLGPSSDPQPNFPPTSFIDGEFPPQSPSWPNSDTLNYDDFSDLVQPSQAVATNEYDAFSDRVPAPQARWAYDAISSPVPATRTPSGAPPSALLGPQPSFDLQPNFPPASFIDSQFQPQSPPWANADTLSYDDYSDLVLAPQAAPSSRDVFLDPASTSLALQRAYDEFSDRVPIGPLPNTAIPTSAYVQPTAHLRDDQRVASDATPDRLILGAQYAQTDDQRGPVPPRAIPTSERGQPHAGSGNDSFAPTDPIGPMPDSHRASEGEAGSSLAQRLGQSTIDTVPGAYFQGLATKQFRAGNYLSGAAYEALAILDAAVGVATLGESSVAENFVRRGATTVASELPTVTTREASVLGKTSQGKADVALSHEADAVAGSLDASTFGDGSFSIHNWTGYPANVSRPAGPFRLSTGEEYTAARDVANRANQAHRAANPTVYVGAHIHAHEILPVKFGGDPKDLANKIPMLAQEHYKLNAWWYKIQREVERGMLK